MISFNTERANGSLGPSIWLLIFVWMWCASLAYARIDSYTLRSTFGPPIMKGPNYEVFRSKGGVEFSVRYLPARRKVCSIEIKSGHAEAAAVEKVLSLAVPIDDRGKMWDRLDEFDGVSGVRRTYYENVIITPDIFTSRALDKRPGATAVFKEHECGWMGVDDPFNREPHSP